MKLSVLMITYNHERFVRQAVDSVLSQDVDFDFEIVIGEDCSTDATRAILLEYARKHPQRFRLLLRERNLGAVRNFFATLDECRGQYVALLEGDDYWTNPRKLHKQAQFLDENPDFAVCFHNVLGRFEDGQQPDFNYVRADQQETMELKDLLRENVIPTCSAVFRRGLFGPAPSWVYELRMGDYPLHVLNAQHGKIGYLNEVMGMYRVHSGGIYTQLDWEQRLLAAIRLFECFARNLQPRYRRAARRELARMYWSLVVEYESRGELALARTYALRSLRTHLFTSSPALRHKLIALARNTTPRTYGAIRAAFGGLRASADGLDHEQRPAAPNPRVSFIVPIYNGQRYLLDAIQSTLSQGFSDFECIVVDDGSTDRTPALLRDLARRDGRLRPLRIPHGGIVEALNAGLRQARGELIARMDADDICLPDRIEKQIRYLDVHPECVAVGSAVMLIDPYGSPLWSITVQTEHEQIEAQLLRGNGWSMFHPSVLARKEALLNVGGYRPEYQWSEDIDLFLRLAEVGRLANLPDVLLRYRQHFSSVNRTKLELQLRRNQRLLIEAYQRRGRPLPENFHVEPPPQLGAYEQIRAWARRAIINRNFRVARRHALAALRNAPFRYESWRLMYHAVSGR